MVCDTTGISFNPDVLNPAKGQGNHLGVTNFVDQGLPQSQKRNLVEKAKCDANINTNDCGAWHYPELASKNFTQQNN
jgi:hypothetical protein